MSFIRPEVRANLWRWREVALTGVIVVLGLRLLLRGAAINSGVYLVLGGAVTILGAALLYLAIQRARFQPNHAAPGVVEVTERQISYLGPIDGQMLSIDALTRVEIRKSEAFGSVWVMYHSDGPSLMVPTAATGAKALFDTFAALKGADMEMMIRATGGATDQTHVIWQDAKTPFSPSTGLSR